MPTTAFEFTLSYRKLLTALLVTVVPISLVSLYIASESGSSIEEEIGNHFATLASSRAASVSSFVHGAVREAALMAASPVVIEAVEESNRLHAPLSDEEFKDKIQSIENAWNQPPGAKIVEEILSRPASEALRRFQRLDPRLLRITVTDQFGATAAATHKTLDYYQADEEYWQAIYANGRGSIHVTDVLYDEATQSHYIGIGTPIVEQGSNRLLGTLDALLDVTELFPVLRGLPGGGAARTLLVKGDGSVIAATPNISLSMNLKSDEYQAVLDELQTVTGYVVASLPKEGETVIGFADTGLKSDYQTIDWVVLVADRSSRALAPVAAIQRLILLLAFLGLAAVTGLAVFFSLHRKSEIEEIEEDFHPEASKAGSP